MFENGLSQSKHIPQLFYKKEGGKVVLIVAKIVGDLKVAGDGKRSEKFLKSFHIRFKLGIINHEPGKLRFFGINNTQNQDFTIAKDADDKLQAVSEYSISGHRRSEADEVLKCIEKAARLLSTVHTDGLAQLHHQSVHSTQAIHSKMLQEQRSVMVEQINIIRKLKKVSTTIIVSLYHCIICRPWVGYYILPKADR